jgi:hypothetical protein
VQSHQAPASSGAFAFSGVDIGRVGARHMIFLFPLNLSLSPTSLLTEEKDQANEKDSPAAHCTAPRPAPARLSFATIRVIRGPTA